MIRSPTLGCLLGLAIALCDVAASAQPVRLGVRIVNTPPGMERVLRGVRGAFVNAVSPGSIGLSAGIRPLDLITAVNDQATPNASAMLEAVNGLAGPPRSVTVLRDGRLLELQPGAVAAGAPQPGVCAAYVVYSRPDDASGLVSGPWPVDDPADPVAVGGLLDRFAAYAHTIDPKLDAPGMNRRGCDPGEGTGGVDCWAASGRFGVAGFGAIECANDVDKITAFNGRDLGWKPPQAAGR